jgi:hypothetical protein
MTTPDGPIYEVTFFVDADVAPGFDAWLEDRAQQCLLQPAVSDYRILARPADHDGRALRVCQLFLDEGADVDSLGNDTLLPEAELAAEFGDHVGCAVRILCEDPLVKGLPGQSSLCLNCGTRLRGQYCGNCGQRSRSRLISLWELVSDAFGDLFELDSRIWQTLIPLVLRPGQLTRDYLNGRRARFMPPFRMYLVLSLVFFLVAFTNPREKFGILFDPTPASEPTAAGADEADTADSRPSDAGQLRQEVFAELVREGIISVDDLPDAAATDPGSSGSDDGATRINCDVTAADVDELPDFLARRMTVERMRHVCERLALDDGRAFLREIVATIPTALIVLLPVMAFVLKVLYPLSRRYYVEHLLFFVHFHAFFFLILTLQILYARLGGRLGVPEWGITLPIVATSFYVPAYLFISMRKVYGQGRFVTFLKYVLLTLSYVAGFTITLVVVALLAAFSL